MPKTTPVKDVPHAEVIANITVTVDDEFKRSGKRTFDFGFRVAGGASGIAKQVAKGIDAQFEQADVFGKRKKAAQQAAADAEAAAEVVAKKAHEDQQKQAEADEKAHQAVKARAAQGEKAAEAAEARNDG